MITVSLLTGTEDPYKEGVKFQLVSSADGSVVASGETDAQGVVTFDVDPATVGQVGLRRELEPAGTP